MHSGKKPRATFITLSSPITVMPFRVNDLHVSNVTSTFQADAWTYSQFHCLSRSLSQWPLFPRSSQQVCPTNAILCSLCVFGYSFIY